MMEVVRPGLLDLVMDLGRPGFRAQGVPEGGAADAPALILANRLGLRLSGPALAYAGGELASQAVLPGAIQAPPDGQPILLGWDGPVTGGYPVIAGVIAADMPRLAQLKPGDRLEFRFVTPEQAQAAWAAQQAFMEEAIRWEA